MKEKPTSTLGDQASCAWVIGLAVKKRSHTLWLLFSLETKQQKRNKSS